MEKTKDRRSYDRLVIPETTALLLEQIWFDLMSNYLSFVIPVNTTKDIIIKDISKSGACIMCEHRYECGDTVHLVVSIPGEKNIWIKGRVRWVKKHDDQIQYFIGTQFYAYGSGKNLNSMRSLEQLRLVHQRESNQYNPIY